MTMQNVIYYSTSELALGCTLPVSVVICVPPSYVVSDICYESEAVNLYPFGFIDGTLVAQCQERGPCGNYWRYIVQYDDEQITPGLLLTTCIIQGMFARSCFSNWVEDLVGEDSYILTEEDGSQSFVNGHGCVYPIIAPTGAQGPQGYEGPMGPQGYEGPQGPTGPFGYEGPEGPVGPMGPEGPMGPIGYPGTPGSEGPKGADGYEYPCDCGDRFLYEYAYEFMYSSEHIIANRSFHSAVLPEAGEAVLGVDGIGVFSTTALDHVYNGFVMPRDYTARRFQAVAIGILDDVDAYVSGSGTLKFYLNGVDTGLDIAITCTDVVTMVTEGLDIDVPLVQGDVLSFTLTTAGGETDMFAGVVSLSGY